MTTPRTFLAVPTDALVVGTQRSTVVAGPAGTGPVQGNHLVAAVPRIYEMLGQGYDDVDFRRLHDTPLSAQERDLGEAYRHLFSTSPVAEPIRARFTDGVGLQVVAGADWVLAARTAGVAHLPVHVEAQDEHTLAAVTRQMESEVERTAPATVAIHRAYDSRHREMREGAQGPELGRRHGERHETDRPWAEPERER